MCKPSWYYSPLDNPTYGAATATHRGPSPLQTSWKGTSSHQEQNKQKYLSACSAIYFLHIAFGWNMLEPPWHLDPKTTPAAVIPTTNHCHKTDIDQLYNPITNVTIVLHILTGSCQLSHLWWDQNIPLLPGAAKRAQLTLGLQHAHTNLPSVRWHQSSQACTVAI